MDGVYWLALLAIAMVVLPWLWRYQIRPHFEKSTLRTLLEKHPEREYLEQVEKQLNILYRGIHSDRLSKKERKRLNLQEDAFIYGEIDFLSFILLLQRMEPQPGEVFYDLGSGSGKAVFAAALSCPLRKACGVELLPALDRLAKTQLNRAFTWFRLLGSNRMNRIQSIEFINSNFLTYDFSDGDLVFINSTCIHYATWKALIEKFKQLKPGSRVMCTSKTIEDPAFELIYQANELMSWGMNSTYIYRRR